MCRLEDSDLDLKARTLRLRETKGGRDDIVYINEECAETQCWRRGPSIRCNKTSFSIKWAGNVALRSSPKYDPIDPFVKSATQV